MITSRFGILMGRYLREGDPNLEGQIYRFAANRETNSKI